MTKETRFAQSNRYGHEGNRLGACRAAKLASIVSSVHEGVTGWPSMVHVRYWSVIILLTFSVLCKPTLAGTNLVYNGDFSLGNAGFSSDFSYNSSSIGGYPTYAVVANPANVHGLAASYGDHTTGAGNMMAANGYAAPPTTLWRQTIQVTPGCTYRFGVWVSTWHSGTATVGPGIRLYVNDVMVLDADGPLAQAIWDERFASWSSGSATSAALRIDNYSGVLRSTSLAIDDVSFALSPGGETGLVGWWKMENRSSGVVYDSSGLGHNATINGTPSFAYASDIDKTYVQFSGGPYMLVNDDDHFDVTNNWTIALWTRPGPPYFGQEFWLDKADTSMQGGFNVSLQNSTRAQVSLYTNGASATAVSGGTIQTGVWQHVSVSYNASSAVASVYINGIAVTNKTACKMQASATSLLLGACHAVGGTVASDYRSQGALADVRIYNRVLSASEIAHIAALVATNTTFSYVRTFGNNAQCGSWCDYDGDGDQDLFVNNYRGDDSYLYRNDGGTFLAAVTFKSTNGWSANSGWGDYNNDGRPDLVVVDTDYFSRLYRNDGNGLLSLVSPAAFSESSAILSSAVWSDYDGDGYLDLYVTRWNSPGSQMTNVLLRNDGQGGFIRVTNSVAVSVKGNSVGACWVDYDNDGRLDLFVTRTYGDTNLLFHNLGGGTFERITDGALVNDTVEGAMGASFGDYDNDGDMDLFVANSTGSNRLYRNDGGIFTRIMSGPIASDPASSYGSAWVDCDNDGYLDLFVANQGRNHYLYHNEGGGSFSKVTNGDWLVSAAYPRGTAWADYDNDGFMDVFIGADSSPSGSKLFHNDGNGNSWLKVRCVGLQSNRSAIGARVKVLATIQGQARWQYRSIQSQNGLNGQGSLIANFGLGDATVVDMVRIEWPSGATQLKTKVTVGQEIIADEKDADVDTDGDGMPDAWENMHGLNPLVDDAAEDRDLDGLSNLLEYEHGLDPQRADSLGDGTNDYRRVYGKEFAAFTYDKIDRLTGAMYSRGSNGFSIAYVYDGNGNIIRQVYLQRDQNGNGIPDLWEFQNGLIFTNANDTNSAYADADGDGWSNYQEWKASSGPTNPLSVPDFSGPVGITAGVFQTGFTPSNFVMGVGQLDGQGPEEVVIGADGDPGNYTNCIWILAQTASGGWTTQRVDIGKVGITSIAIGQPANTVSPAIYLGARQPGGTGAIVQVQQVGSNWLVTNLVASTSSVAYVLGVRSNSDVLINLGRTNAPDQCLTSLQVGTNRLWAMTTWDTNTAHRGIGMLVKRTDAFNDMSVQLLDSGEIQVAGGYGNPAVAVEGLVDWYPLDGNADDLIGTNAGVLHGATPAPDRFGVAGKALTFNGNTDYVSVGSITLSSNYSLIAWIQFASSPRTPVSDFQTIFSCGQEPGWELGIFGEGGQSDRLGWGGQLVTPAPIIGSNWCHIAAVVNASNVAMYVNGGLVVQGQVNTGIRVLRDIGIFLPTGVDVGSREPWNGTIDDARLYNRTLSSNEVRALYTNSVANQLVTVSAGDAPRINPILNRGRLFAFGSARTNASLLFSLVEDMDGSGMPNAGDQFRTEEYVKEGMSWVPRTVSRIPMTAQSPNPYYGLACVNYLNSSNKVFFTGEPDGRVCAWTVPSATGTLQRLLFSADYSGKAWHQMEAVGTGTASEWLMGLMVDPTNPAVCKLIGWAPQPTLWQPPVVPQTQPTTRVAADPSVGGGLAAINLSIFDGEGNSAHPVVQWSFGGGAWSNATVLRIDSQPYTSTVFVAAMPAGIVHSLLWDARRDLGNGFNGNVQLRARSMDNSGWGAWSSTVDYHVGVTAMVRVTPSAGQHGSITPAMPVEVAVGGGTNFLIAADANYHISNILTNGVSLGGVFDNGCTATNFTWTNITTDGQVEARFAVNEYSFTVANSRGVGMPADGTAPYTHGASIGCRLSSGVVEADGTQQVCLGWSGTGSVVSNPTGGTNAGPFVITADSSLSWQWQTRYRFDVSAVGGTVDRSNGWYAANDAFPVTATAGPDAQFERWVGDISGCPTNGSTIAVVMDRPRSISAQFTGAPKQVVVVTPHGSAVPPSGTNWVAFGATIIPAITNSPVVDSTTRYVCVGWLGEGCITSNPTGGTNAGPFGIASNSAIAWLWETNYLLTLSADSGVVDATNGWRQRGSSVEVTATATTNYHFIGWSGETNGCAINGPRITVLMNQGRAIEAHFGPDARMIEIRSQRPEVLPPVGLYTNDYGTAMTNLALSPAVQGGTQYVCTGWTMTSNAPLSGPGTSASMILTNNAVLTWNWGTTNYRFTVVAEGKGFFTGDGNGWYTPGARLFGVPTASNNYHFGYWTGDTAGWIVNASIAFGELDRPRTIVGHFIGDDRRLVVTSPYGRGLPTSGTNVYPYESLVECGITNAPVTLGATQYVCQGWSGTGNVVSSPTGGTNTGPFTMTVDSSVTWIWKTNYWLNLAASNGVVDVTNGWQEAASNVLVSATPTNHYHFSHWSGDTNGCQVESNRITVATSRARTIVANFALDQYPVTVEGGHGVSVPGDGMSLRDYGVAVSYFVSNALVTQGSTQYACRGWMGTGSVSPNPVGGTNTGPFTVTNASSLTWLWQTNYWLEVTNAGSGAIDVANGWLMAGSNTMAVASAAPGYRFNRWSGDTNGCVLAGAAIIVPMTQPRRIAAVFDPETHVMVIMSERGMSTPAPGVYMLPHATNLLCSVTNATISMGATQYVCVGWMGAGSIPANGLGTSTAPFDLTMDSAVAWKWRTEYRISLESTGLGALDQGNSWVAEGSNIAVKALAAPYQHLEAWTGDTNGCSINGNQISAMVDMPRTITANFAPNLAPLGTPEWWLAQHGWTNSMSSAETNDSDHDGVPTWQEWLSDTDPTNADSVLRLMSVEPVSNGYKITWKGGTGAWQYVETRQDLGMVYEEWRVIFTNSQLPTAVLTNMIAPAGTNKSLFYRIRALRQDAP